MKKLLSIVAVLSIIATACIMGVGTVAFAAEESSPDDFLVYDGILEEYVGDGGDIVIPASLGVKEIAANAFGNNTDITSVVIPEGVEVVGYWSFRNCTSLESVTLPYSLTTLAEHAFSAAPITEITIPGNCEIVGYGCFSGCEYLEKITLSYGVREIMVLSFQGTAATKVVFPETVELICGSSFGHNKAVNVGTIEYYICNPDCEVFVTVTGSQKASRHEWEREESIWSHNKGDATIKVYVPEGSSVAAAMEEHGEEYLRRVDSGRGDGWKLYKKEKAFFDELPENQKGYGTQKPTSTGTNNNTDGNNDKDNVNGNGNSNNNNNNANTNNTNNTNNKQNTNDVIYQQSANDNTALFIIIGVIGGVMVIAIIVVVILAATGKLFGTKKPAESAAIDASDPEALKAALAKIEAEKTKIDANDPEALKAALEQLENAQTEADGITEEE